MGRTVEQGFVEFLSRLTPTATESAAAKSHRESIRQCLETNIGMTGFFRSGSFGNGTSIRGYSDTDYFAVIPEVNLAHNSQVMLRKVRAVLEQRFPSTGVRVSTPAVAAPFGTSLSERIEVIPAYHARDLQGYATYGIPDYSAGGWMEASVEAQKALVSEVDASLGGKVKPLIRFLKAWKYFRNVPLLSFYLEMRATSYASEQDYIEYAVDLRSILYHLLKIRLAAMRDPLGLFGLIRPCTLDAQHADALSRLQMAATRADKAIEAEGKGNIPQAFGLWNLVFAGKFPTYG
ncbi:MAG: nucleotidyltransferase [Bacillota bacterium]